MARKGRDTSMHEDRQEQQVVLEFIFVLKAQTRLSCADKANRPAEIRLSPRWRRVKIVQALPETEKKPVNPVNPVWIDFLIDLF